MIYEYECPKCKVIIEVELKITEKPPIYCKKCRIKMKRLVSGGSGFILRGKGWPGKGT